MKPAPFVYLRPTTVAEALEMVGAAGDSGKILAGGQSLVPLLNMRLARPGHLIDLNFVDGLDGIEDADGWLRIGAMVRQRDLELSPLAAARVPLAVEALGHVAHVQIRHRGTVGGNLAHADPSSELPAVMRCLDAVFVARGPDGERRIDAADFFAGVFTTALADDELLTHVEVPPRPPGRGEAFEEFARRRGDFALVGVAAAVDVADGRIEQARLCLAGVSMRPHRATAAEQALAGADVADESALRAATEAAVSGLDPATDLEAPPEYRLALAQELVRRAARRATQRAAGRNASAEEER